MDPILKTLSSAAEFRDCLALQREIFRFSDLEIIPVHLLRAVHRSGGIVIAGFDQQRPVGLSIAMRAGSESGGDYFYSHMTGVVDTHRRLGIGYSLKKYQQRIALDQGITQIRWVYDPFLTFNGFFNLVKLGARVDRFLANEYGTLESSYFGNEPTDRFRVVWDLRIKAEISPDSPLWESESVIEELSEINGAPRFAAEQIRTSARSFRCPVPLNFVALREKAPSIAASWRMAVREMGLLLLQGDYEIVSIRLRPESQRADYLLIRHGEV